MKTNLITLLLAALIINAASGFDQKNLILVDIPGKGRIVKVGEDGNQSLRFYNERGKLIKTIPFKTDTVKTGKGLRVTAYLGFIESLKNCYVGAVKYEYDPAIEYRVVPWVKNWSEYYNPRGKLLWRRESSGMSVSEDGSKVVLMIPILSPQATDYEYPEIADPKSRARLLVVDSLGRELFRYEADSSRGYSYSGFNISDDIIITDLTFFQDPSIKDFKDQRLYFTKVISIKHKKAHTVPHDTAVKYDYGVDKDYNVIYTSKEDINKGVTPFRRIIPLGEWK